MGWEGEDKQGVSLFNLVEGKLRKRGVQMQKGLMKDQKVKEMFRKFQKHLVDLKILEVCEQIVLI